MQKMVIIRVDGGICSQIEFVALGLWLNRKFNVQIKYDLSWFEKYGKDSNGVFDRNWDMPKAFPEFELSVANEDEITFIKSLGNNCQSFENCISLCEKGESGYVCGYPNRSIAFIELLEEFKDSFNPDVRGDDLTLLNEIMSGPSCAVHVRRGDLSVPNPCYGHPTSVKYFHDAMTIVRGLHPGTKFYVFSDEPDWVSKNILLDETKKNDCKICAMNGSDKGYLDLYLMSRCNRIISSHGSLGVLGALLSQKNDLLVMSRYREYVCKVLKHVIYMNDDCYGTKLEWALDAVKSVSVPKKVKVKKDGWRKPLYKIYKKIGKLIAVN